MSGARGPFTRCCRPIWRFYASEPVEVILLDRWMPVWARQRLFRGARRRMPPRWRRPRP